MAPDPPAPQPRPAIQRMHPYEWEPPSAAIARQTGVPEDQVIRFDTNTFPWPGASLDQLPATPLNEYPDTTYGALAEAIAQYADVPTDRITIGAGADEVLQMVAQSYIDDSATVVISRPTYPMFTVLTEIAGGSIDAVAAIDLSLDRPSFMEHAQNATITWLSNPNNPTGELLPLDFVDDLTRRAGGLVVVDEAYFEISGVSALPLIEDRPNLVVVRTLSKGFGLAGVRVGYGLAGPDISSVLRRVRPPNSVSAVSIALAVQALSNVNQMRDRVARLLAERQRLQAEFAGMGLEVRESAANFLLVKAGKDAATFLLRHGLVVRTFPANSMLGNYVRITVRRPEENARLVDVLRSSLTPTRP